MATYTLTGKSIVIYRKNTAGQYVPTKLGITTKSLEVSNTTLDTSSDDDGVYRTISPDIGQKTATISLEGNKHEDFTADAILAPIVNNSCKHLRLDLKLFYFAGACVLNKDTGKALEPPFKVFEGGFVFENKSDSGATNEAVTWSVSAQSDGYFQERAYDAALDPEIEIETATP